jgi:heme/copper-type cytochrome/quinol oxidase subunit 2
MKRQNKQQSDELVVFFKTVTIIFLIVFMTVGIGLMVKFEKYGKPSTLEQNSSRTYNVDKTDYDR